MPVSLFHVLFLFVRYLEAPDQGVAVVDDVVFADGDGGEP
jgi:hypothetical protein